MATRARGGVKPPLHIMGNLDLDAALASCSYYPVKIDLCRRLIWFAEIDREMYRRAGFLAPRQAKMSEERYGFNLDDVLLYDLSLPIGGAPSHYVFISAFCCSTLLARLLDCVPGCLVLKEPSILGQLGMMRYRPGVSVIPAQAGIHVPDVDPRFRGDDTWGQKDVGPRGRRSNASNGHS